MDQTFVPIPGVEFHGPGTPNADLVIEENDDILSTPDRSDMLVKAIGAGVITVTVVAGGVLIVAGVISAVTWVLGGIASFLTAVAPWAAVLLGIAAYSAYRHY